MCYSTSWPESYKLAYASRVDGAWTTQLVNPSDQLQCGAVSLALDAQDRAHILFHDSDQNNFTYTSLRYAVHSEAGWSVEIVDSLYVWWAQLVLDSSGVPHALYKGQDCLRYACKVGSAWVIDTLPVPPTSGYWPSLALDAGARPHVGFYDSENGRLCYGAKRDSVWEFTVVDSGVDVGLATSIAVSAAGDPCIAYGDGSQGVVRFAFKDGGVWSVETVDATDNPWGRVSLALDAGGEAHLSYQADGRLLYGERSAGVWTSWGVDAWGATGYGSTLSLDLSGRPHMTYGDDTHDQFRYAELAPSGEVTLSGVVSKTCRGETTVAGPTSVVLLNGGTPEDSTVTTFGLYQFAGVPLGSYLVRPTAPPGFESTPADTPVRLAQADSTAQVDFSLLCLSDSVFAAPVLVDVSNSSTESQEPRVIGALDGSIVVLCSRQGDHQVVAARSVDGGVHFSAPVVISGEGGGARVQASMDPRGTILVAWTSGSKILFGCSTDHGVSFRPPVLVAEVAQPGTGSASGLMVAGDSSGRAYVAWSEYTHIAYARSEDGITFSGATNLLAAWGFPETYLNPGGIVGLSVDSLDRVKLFIGRRDAVSTNSAWLYRSCSVDYGANFPFPSKILFLDGIRDVGAIHEDALGKLEIMSYRYPEDGQAYVEYLRSPDAGTTFTDSTRVLMGRSPGGSSPQMATDSNGVIHVTMGRMNGLSNQPDVYYMRSADGGGSFTPPVNLSNSSTISMDAHLALDQSGSPVVVWTEDCTGNYDWEVLLARTVASGGESGSLSQLKTVPMEPAWIERSPRRDR